MSQGRATPAQLLKFLLGAAFFFWMVYSGKLDVRQVTGSLARWPTLLAMACLLYLQCAVTAWRWNLLLRAQEIRIPYRRTFGLTMIGLLFNLVIPGAVGGDVIKGYYITRAAPGCRPQAATSVLMDRIIGVLGLFLLAALVSTFHFRTLDQNTMTRHLVTFVIAGLVGGTLVIYTAVVAGARLSEWQVLPRVLGSAFLSLSKYHEKSSVIPIAVAVTLLSHSLSCLAYFLAMRSTGQAGDVTVANFFLLVPLGLLATAIPISPAGIGVGQAAFFALFRIVSLAHATAAASAFTVFQLVTILISLSGLYSYLSYKHSAIPDSVDLADADVVRAPRPGVYTWLRRRETDD
jgi:uncharacterized membrane protein YbhN (UPF0104 family)